MTSLELNLDPIECSAQPLDLAFHPTRPTLVAAALVDGTLEVHDFSTSKDDDDAENDTIVSSIPVHTELLPSKQEGGQPHEASCRSVLFSSCSNHVYTGGSAGDVVALDTEQACTFGSSTPKLLWRVTGGKERGIQTMHQLDPSSCAGPLLVTGDEDGGVRLWDERLCGNDDSQSKSKLPRGCVISWEDKHKDYISGFAHDIHNNGNTLLASSADCTLGVFDLHKAVCPTKPQKRQEAVRQSDDQEDELLSIAVLKNGKKVVCGTQEGVLAVWSWGVWGDVSDRFPGHPASIDALLKVDEDTVLTGCSDGLLRVVQIHPDKLLGVLGDHDGFPIEKLKFNATKSHIGSSSHDSMIRLWDASVLQEQSDGEEEEDETKSSNLMAFKPPATSARTSAATTGQGSDDDCDDDDEEEQDDSLNESDDSDEDEKLSTNEKRAKRFKTANEEFFADL